MRSSITATGGLALSKHKKELHIYISFPCFKSLSSGKSSISWLQRHKLTMDIWVLAMSGEKLSAEKAHFLKCQIFIYCAQLTSYKQILETFRDCGRLKNLGVMSIWLDRENLYPSQQGKESLILFKQRGYRTTAKRNNMQSTTARHSSNASASGSEKSGFMSEIKCCWFVLLRGRANNRHTTVSSFDAENLNHVRGENVSKWSYSP